MWFSLDKKQDNNLADDSVNYNSINYNSSQEMNISKIVINSTNKNDKDSLTETTINDNNVNKDDFYTTDIEFGANGHSDSNDSDTYEEDGLPDDLKEIPKIVREVVTFKDNPEEVCFSLRVIFLSIIFILPGAFLDTMNSYRTTSAAYSIFFVQICSYWFGEWLAKIVPNYSFNVPYFTIGKDFKIVVKFLKVETNPGPWSIKENVLITLAAASGATSNQGTTPISLAEAFYGDRVNPAVAIFFMWCINLSGYALSYLARNFLIYDPQFIWPQALMQTTLFNNMKKQEDVTDDTKSNVVTQKNKTYEKKKRMRWFFLCVIGMCLWEFLPEYVWPMLSSLSFLCWVAPENYVANFVGGGLGGMGLLNVSLDWSNITSSVLLSPYWTICVQFAAFVFGCWVLIPAAKWGKMHSKEFGSKGLMSNSLFLQNGTKYPTSEILIYSKHGSTQQVSLNQTKYEELGPIFIGAQNAWIMFFDYAAFISSFTWIALFGRKQLVANFHKLKVIFKKNSSRKPSDNINLQYSDRLNKIQSKYEEVPFWWFAILMATTFIILIVIFALNEMFIPWWSYFVALGIGSLIVIPLSYLYAISNFQLAIGSFDELIYGSMVENLKTYKHPASASTYGALSGDMWYRAQYILQDQKIGHYMHIPPKYVFLSQILGQIIGVPMNYGTLRWILNNKIDYITGAKTDPLHQWTGQSLTSYNTKAVLMIIVGPTNFFKQGSNKVIPFGFLVGALAPVLIYCLHRKWRKFGFNYWNVTIFCSTMANFYGNMSTGFFTQFAVGSFSMYYLYNFKHTLWKNYNYLTAAAFDTGYNLAVLLIFIIFSSGKIIEMPNWWGNNADSVERCFALNKS
ncbi:related to sexual differentiation process protein isp4 [Saccharomycodes ludwigii]|uniref:Related to sexual differentiation process protein isp4 n=1 Tax=Saccharomycodes ludwigii TaxID=36035 RepID=A0A376B8D6_9ASCO|nr:related to sexual differentiation process protein isp4 [Saccharomycodes ludwigii]